MSDMYLTADDGFVCKDKPFVIRAINGIISSRLFVFVLAALTCLAFTFSREFEFYLFAVTYAIYVSVFAHDLAPLMPLFAFCYVAPSYENNPGITTESVFYGKTGTFLLVYVLIMTAVIFVRIARDENMGIKKLLFKRRFLTFGMLLLGASYLLSGILWEGYAEYAKRNLIFASVQFLSIFLLYFVFSASVDWSRFKVSYFACIGLALGLVIVYELIWIYLNVELVSVHGVIEKSFIYTGWGISNNIGALLTMCIPFSFYFASKKLFPAPYMMLGAAFFAFVFLTCSRTATLCAIGIFGLSYLWLLVTARNKLGVYVTTLLGLAGTVLLIIRYQSELLQWIKATAEIFELYHTVDGEVVLNDWDRIKNYKLGIEGFKEQMIFGKTFYPTDAEVQTFSTLESFKDFFPPRWHNTIVQILVSCGIVGIVSYAIHRLSTVVLFLKKRSDINTAIGISVLALLLTSLLDCHFFNIGPVLLYSMMLAVAEFGNER